MWTAWIIAALLGAGPAGSGTVKGHTTAGRAAARLRPLATVSNLAVSPTSITFTATDPDLGTVVGPATTVTWHATNQDNGKTWTLKVAASASTFAGCATVPASAVTVKCSSASVTAGGTGICGGAVGLSTSSQQLASGHEGNSDANYTVNLSFTLADSWKYIATQTPSCTLTLTYTATVP